MTESFTESFQVEPIGWVRTSFGQKYGTPRQSQLAPSLRARVELKASCQPELSLEGLAQFEYVWILSWFHANTNQEFHSKIQAPRLRGEKIGLFATRSPHRPNPIALSLGRIVEVGKNFVDIAGVDLLDGTPVLDLKPYLPEVEAFPEARSGWTRPSSEGIVQVQFSVEAEEFLRQRPITKKGEKFRLALVELFQQDPRSLHQHEVGAPDILYGLLFDGWNVLFSFPSPNICRIERLEVELTSRSR